MLNFLWLVDKIEVEKLWGSRIYRKGVQSSELLSLRKRTRKEGWDKMVAERMKEEESRGGAKEKVVKLNLMACCSLWGLRKQILELRELSGSEIGLHILHTEPAVLAWLGERTWDHYRQSCLAPCQLAQVISSPKWQLPPGLRFLKTKLK